MTRDEKVDEYTRAMLVEAREELVRADGKAGLLLASSGVAIGALLGGLLSRSWSPFTLDDRVQWLWWLGVVAVVYGLYRLGGAVWPRVAREGDPPGVVAYYGDVHSYAEKPTADLEAALRASAADPTVRLVDQLQQVARIVVAKYDGIRAALVALPVAAVLCTAAVIVDAALK